MSQSGRDRRAWSSWPFNAFSEIPFRVYTDQEQYADREQERLFKARPGITCA